MLLHSTSSCYKLGWGHGDEEVALEGPRSRTVWGLTWPVGSPPFLSIPMVCVYCAILQHSVYFIKVSLGVEALALDSDAVFSPGKSGSAR